MRQIVLDTETTGLEPEEGHRIIEIGCLEMVNRRLTGREFHRYLNPERSVEYGAVQVHGLDDEFLGDKPLFAEIAADFLDFIRGAELIIHNAAFDIGFLDAELARLSEPVRVADCATILDTLELARELHPGQRVSLDALCRRYEVDNTERSLHGALLDAQLLAEVYLLMTGGQVSLDLELNQGSAETGAGGAERVDPARLVYKPASPEEWSAHRALIDKIAKAAGDNGTRWRELDASLG